MLLYLFIIKKRELCMLLISTLLILLWLIPFNAEANVCKGSGSCYTNEEVCTPTGCWPPNPINCSCTRQECVEYIASGPCYSFGPDPCHWDCGASGDYCQNENCRWAYCGDGYCEADVENIVCGGGGYCWQDCSTLGEPGTACTDGDGCPGLVTCNPGGNGTYCQKLDINCPCGYTVNGLSNNPSEACDVNVGSCTVPPCNPKQDYDEDTCSANCSDNSMPMCRYTVDAPFTTVGGEKVARSGVSINADLDRPIDSYVKKFFAGVGHAGDLDDPISITPNSSYGNHTGAGPVVEVENRSNQGFCARESFLTDHFPTVHDVNILNYREISSAINTSAVANGSYEYTDWDSKWSGKFDDGTSVVPVGGGLPTEIIIPYISNNNTVDSCDNKNPVVFNVVIRDGDDMREVDQINVLLADPTDPAISALAVNQWTGGCRALETKAASDYFGVTLQKQNAGNWTINNLCGISNPKYEFVRMDLGAIESDLLYKSATPGDNFMNIAFAVKFNDEGDAFPEGFMKVWVKARSSYEANGRTHYMYSGWNTNPNGGDVYSSDNNWRWGIDFTAPGDNNNSHEMATAEIIDFNWSISDPKVGFLNNVDGSGMRYMDFGCALPSEKNGPDGALFSAYPFFTSATLPVTWDGRLDVYVDRMNKIFENCGIAKKWVGGEKSDTDPPQIIPYFTLPVENVNSRVSFDGSNKDKSNPIPPGCENGDNLASCTNIFETTVRNPDYNYVGNAVTWNVPYREFKQMDFLRIYNQVGFTGLSAVNVQKYIAGVEEKKSYNLRALVADRACNVRLVEEDISVGGKWMQTVGAEVYTKLGFNTKLMPDTTPYFESVSPLNSKNSMSTFGVTVGLNQSVPTSNIYAILGSAEQYAESGHASKNLGEYDLYDVKVPVNDRSMITQEVFRVGGIWDRLYEAATKEEEVTGNSRTFIMRQDITTEPSDCSYCNITPSSCNAETKCWNNTWESDLVRFISRPEFKGGVIKMEVKNGAQVFFEGNMMRNIEKDVVLLFYRKDVGVITPLSRVHFWPATFANAANNPRIIVLAKSDIFSTGSTGHDWEYEPNLRQAVATFSPSTNWNQVWRTDDDRRVPSNNVIGGHNLDKHVYFEPQPPYPPNQASSIEYGSTPGQVIDPGVDMYKMFVVVNGKFESWSEDSVSADPDELEPLGPLKVADVIDRNYERMEIWGGVAAKTLSLDRNLTALDNIYMPADKFVYDAGLIDAFAKANKQMGIFSQGSSNWQEIGINY